MNLKATVADAAREPSFQAALDPARERMQVRSAGIRIGFIRPALALSGHMRHVGSLKLEPDSKGSAVKKLACFRRIRAFADGPMMATWPRRGSHRVSTAVLHRPNPVAREMPGLLGFSHVMDKWRRGRDSHPAKNSASAGASEISRFQNQLELLRVAMLEVGGSAHPGVAEISGTRRGTD
jgi:hypothetical protein